MSWPKRISQVVLSLFMITAGCLHFIIPDFYVKIMPLYLPWHRELVAISGVCEIALGVLLLVPKLTRWAAWGIIALLIAVFPANIHVALHHEMFPGLPYIVHLLRLPLQGVFILWSWWHTRPDKPHPDNHTAESAG